MSMEKGHIFKYKGITLKAVKVKKRTCNGCYFFENDIVCLAKAIPSCEDSYIFVEIKN